MMKTPATESLNADLYTPANGSTAATITSAGVNAYGRLYHSVAMLLPDATVWLAGGNPTRGTYEPHVEVYQPPYLFQSNGSLATRPTITSAPATISYGNNFTVQTPNAANIASAVLVRNGSVTHAFGMDQRMVGMSFTAGSGSLTVTAPPNGNIAPPGYYMLFLLNTAGVPSVSTFVQIGTSSNPAPTVSSISPASGTINGGTGVSIMGTGFQNGATVAFGGTAATGVTVANSTTITATTPAHGAGATNVVVTNTDGQSGDLSGGYTYTSALGGGIGFTQSASGPSSLQASSPTAAATYPAPQMAGDLNVVAVGWADATSSVSSVTDSTGNIYTRAVGPTANGSIQQSIYYARNIAAGNNTVTATFNQSAAYPDIRILEYSGLDPNTPLDVTAAATGTGTGANSGTATTTSSNELLFGAGSTAGDFVGAGTGFNSRIINIFGNLAEDEAVTSTGSYRATAPNSAGNWVMQLATFRTSGEGGSNPAPTVSGISPTSGTTAGGTAVTITGTGFLAGATVSVGGTAATGVHVVTSTSITAVTPGHSAGAADVTVTNTDAQHGTLSQAFTYTSVSNPLPTVTAISPNKGSVSGGTAVTITGTGFQTGASVTFGGTLASIATMVNSTTLTATTPAHAAGAVSVVVTNTEEQSGTLANGYTYVASNPAPTVASIAPKTGPATGGTTVTITGAGFQTGATVTLGGNAASGVSVASAQSITATTPSHAAGTVNVVVSNSDGQSGTLANGFSYAAATSGLGLGVPAGDSSSATVSAGQTATYILSIGGAGSSGTAAFTCAGAPKGATCTGPTSQQFSASTPTTVNISVATTARTMGSLHTSGFKPAIWMWSLSMLGMVLLPTVRSSKRSAARYLRLAPLTLLLLLASCGGGGMGAGSTSANGGGSPQTNPNGTPAGTYTLNVTATSGTASQTATLTLIVQ